MKKNKTQKGIQASIAGFIFYIFASLSLSLHLCLWMFIYMIAGILWLAGIGWIYSDRENYREQHGKSAEFSAYLFGAAVLLLIVGISYFTLESYTYVMTPLGGTLSKDDTHALFYANIVFSYIQLFAIVLLSCSRMFAVYNLENKMGKRVILLAFISMLIISAFVFMQYNGGYQDQDQKNSKNASTAFFKSGIDSQFNTIYTQQNMIYLLLPAIHEILFSVSYYMVSKRIAIGELKSKAKEE